MVGAYYRERRGRAYGVYNAIKGAGYVVSPAIGTAIVAGSQFSNIFLVSAAIGALGFALSLTLPKAAEDQASLDDDDDHFSMASFLAVFRRSDLWPWYLVTVVNMFLVGILFGFLPVRVHDLGYGPVATGIVLTAASASYLLVQPIAGSTPGLPLLLSPSCPLAYCAMCRCSSPLSPRVSGSASCGRIRMLSSAVGRAAASSARPWGRQGRSRSSETCSARF